MIAAIVAPGITPAVAIPTTISGSYSRATLSARARENSPKSCQATSSTPFVGSTLVGLGDILFPSESFNRPDLHRRTGHLLRKLPGYPLPARRAPAHS